MYTSSHLFNKRSTVESGIFCYMCVLNKSSRADYGSTNGSVVCNLD